MEEAPYDDCVELGELGQEILSMAEDLWEEASDLVIPFCAIFVLQCCRQLLFNDGLH